MKLTSAQIDTLTFAVKNGGQIHWRTRKQTIEVLQRLGLIVYVKFLHNPADRDAAEYRLAHFVKKAQILLEDPNAWEQALDVLYEAKQVQSTLARKIWVLSVAGRAEVAKHTKAVQAAC